MTEDKVLEIGDWKIELIDKSGYYTLGPVMHNGKEVECEEVTIRLRAGQPVTIDVDGAFMRP